MIVNWYSTHPDPGELSQRLRTAYALWLSSGTSRRLPILKQIEASPLYSDLADYAALIENRGVDEDPQLVFVTAGAKVVELYGTGLAKRPLDEVLTESGKFLSREIHETLRKDAKPVHLSVTGSPIIASDIEALVVPLLRDEGNERLDLLIYDF